MPLTPLTVQAIRALKEQGLSNNQIIQQLQRQGYTSTQVFDALNQDAVQETLPGMAPHEPAQQNTPSQAPQALNSSQGEKPLMQEGPTQSQPVRASLAQAPRMQAAQPGVSQEEVIEAIIDEKWNDLLEDVQRIISWKEKTSEQITTLETQMKDLKDQFDRLHKAVVGKVGEYDQHILQVGAEVKAMEKVFSKVLPVFTENVGELSRVADSLKASAKKK